MTIGFPIGGLGEEYGMRVGQLFLVSMVIVINKLERKYNKTCLNLLDKVSITR